MPYDNPLNRSIAEQTRRNNEAYINNTLNSYDVAEGNVGYANKKLLDESNVGQVSARNELLEGGAYGAKGGFGKGTWRDTGYERVEGCGKYMNNEVVYEENPNNQYGGGFFSSLKKTFAKIAKPASAILGLVPLPQAQLASKALGVAGDLAGGKKKRGRKPKVSKDKELILSRDTMTGGNPNKNDVGELMKVLGTKKGRGRPKKMKGCGGDGLAQPYNMVKPDGTTGSGKPKERIIGGKKLVPVANMHSSGMSGQGKGSRTDLIRKIMKERGVSMIKASSIIKKENLY
jgi:hypothetical protein